MTWFGSRKKESEVAQSCPTLCDPVDCRLPGSFVHGIFQARVLEWVAISKGLSNTDTKPEPVTIPLGPWSTISIQMFSHLHTGTKKCLLSSLSLLDTLLWTRWRCIVHEFRLFVEPVTRLQSSVFSKQPPRKGGLWVWCVYTCVWGVQPRLSIPQPCSSETGSQERGGQEPLRFN